MMLKLMQGMQSMQQQLMKREKKGKRTDIEDEENEETVRSTQDLHPLPEWSKRERPNGFSRLGFDCGFAACGLILELSYVVGEDHGGCTSLVQRSSEAEAS